MKWALTTIFIVWPLQFSRGIKCFSCDGVCHHRSSKCNCQTGLCDGPYCFTMRTNDVKNGLYVIKGCANRLPTDNTGTLYDKAAKQTYAYCDTNFCNSLIDEPRMPYLLNMTCNDCWDTVGDCPTTCSEANYCRTEISKKRSTCAFGLPNLPYFYRTRKLVRESYARAGVCYSLLEGRALYRHECICAYPKCNNQNLLRNTEYDPDLTLHTCYSCSESSGAEISPATCREKTCLGHICTLTVRTIVSLKTGLRYERIAGCLNTTHPEYVMTGCLQQWVTDRDEIIQCACAGSFCNKSVSQAYRDNAINSAIEFHSLMIICYFLLCLIKL